MNDDDPGPSSAARQLPPRSDGEGDAREHDDDVRAEESSDGQFNDEPSPQLRERQREGLAKKLELISHLQKSLDMIVFVYIGTLYYMECSLVRFLLRIVPHYSLLTPKDGLLLPAEHPHIYSIFVPAVLCMLSHIFFALPQAGEATRGYLHGGVIIDFIGQKPPTTRLALLLIDLVILGAQCLMLAVHQEREKLKKAVSPELRAFNPLADQTEPNAAEGAGQDHDAEERGVLRDQMHMADDGGTDTSREDSRTPANDGQTGDTYSSPAANVDMLDMIRSGNAVLSSFHVIHALRGVGSGARNAATYSLRTIGYSATLAAIAAERRSRLLREQQR
ncbi:hypothetical protein VTK56DRAFT_301 [Thermocarpiscus australiensis]